MARAGLGIAPQELADLAGVSYPTLNRFEKGAQVSQESVDAIREALVYEGATFNASGGMLVTSVPRLPSVSEMLSAARAAPDTPANRAMIEELEGLHGAKVEHAKVRRLIREKGGRVSPPE